MVGNRYLRFNDIFSEKIMFYLTLNFKFNFSNLLSEIKENRLEFKKHDHNMPTAILPDFYANEIKKIINTEPETKIYVHNLLPLKLLSKKETPYLTNWHIDSHRKSAILIQISADNINHYAEFRKGDIVEKAPYTQGVPLIFNVKAAHRVQNTDDTLSRNMISVQYRNLTFDELCNKYQNGSLINYNNFENNIFNPTLL